MSEEKNTITVDPSAVKVAALRHSISHQTGRLRWSKEGRLQQEESELEYEGHTCVSIKTAWVDVPTEGET